MTSPDSSWQTDDGDPVHVSVRGNNHVVIGGPQAQEAVAQSPSRQPAALIGILLAVAVGAAFLNGAFTLRGQTTTESVTTIRITAGGVSPASVSVRPGDRIAWRNDDDIPHIIASSTLATEDSTPLESAPIFPGETFETRIATGAPSGSHTYISRTSTTINGTVIVSADGSAAASSVPIVTQQSSSQPTLASSSAAPAVLSSAPSFPTASSSPTLPASTTTPTGVPTNPFTVDSTAQPATTTPPVQRSSAPPAITQTRTQPLSQPSSGVGTWLMLAPALAGTWLLARGALKKG